MKNRSRPLWLPAVLLFVLVPVFAGLGTWQLHRAEQKRTLQQEYDQRINQAPLRLDATLQSADSLRFRRIIARGTYEREYQILLDNRVHQGVVGYHVITPLKLEDGKTRVLVNRGWVPLGESRETLPSVDAPAGLQDVSGVATVPAEKGFDLSVPAPGWQPIWQRLDMKRYGASVPFSVQHVVILLDANAAGGYVRDWARLDAGIAVHQGYAFQWFSLATLTVVGLILMVRHGRRRKKGQR